MSRRDEMPEWLRDDSSENGLVMRRAVERRKYSTADPHEWWSLALAERLIKVPRENWSRKLLELVAEQYLEEWKPKLEAEWERSPERDRKMINGLADWLKARGHRACRTKAEKMVAAYQGVTVHALRQRRYRPRRRRRAKV